MFQLGSLIQPRQLSNNTPGSISAQFAHDCTASTGALLMLAHEQFKLKYHCLRRFVVSLRLVRHPDFGTSSSSEQSPCILLFDVPHASSHALGPEMRPRFSGHPPCSAVPLHWSSPRSGYPRCPAIVFQRPYALVGHPLSVAIPSEWASYCSGYHLLVAISLVRPNLSHQSFIPSNDLYNLVSAPENQR